MKKVSLETMQSHGALLIPNVTYGFQNYDNQILEKSAEEYLQLLRQLTISCESAGFPAFADFYFANLTPEQQDNIRKHLCPWQQARIQELGLIAGDIYFQIEGADDPDLELLADLTARELLFSTFYFTKPVCTVWGNWELKYPVFYNTKKE